MMYGCYGVIRLTTLLGAFFVGNLSLGQECDTPLTAKKQSGAINFIDEDTDRAMYETAIDVLAAADYGQYEISNFAKANFECGHNVGYWQNHVRHMPWTGTGANGGANPLLQIGVELGAFPQPHE